MTESVDQLLQFKKKKNMSHIFSFLLDISNPYIYLGNFPILLVYLTWFELLLKGF